MIIYPAIDIKGGQTVRLKMGNYDDAEVIGASPLEVARHFEEEGARYLHIVDLDGAKIGDTPNYDMICEIIRSTSMKVQIGGGIRSHSIISGYLNEGADRVILGTMAISHFPFLCDMVKKYGDKIVVSVDAKDGYVATDAWSSVAKVSSIDFCKRLCGVGVHTIIYTETSKNGMLSGVDLDLYRTLCGIGGVNIIASGGISSYDDIEKLRDMGIYAAILGKSVYSRALSIPEARRIAGCED